jgi:ABC-type Na+ efflux pump permease subunit
MVWMLGGVGLMILGFILMAGGRSEDPYVFIADDVYSTTRITIAPIVILLGLVALIFSIFRQPK